MVAFATVLAAMLPAALSDSCAANPSSRAQFVTGQVQLVPSVPAGMWTPPIELASAVLVCDPEREQLALLGVDAKQRVHLWVLQPQGNGWLVLRELDGLPSVGAAALSEGRLSLGVVRRGTSELWLMPASGKARPDVRQLGAPVTALVLSGDRSIWWVATGTELRGFGRDDGSTRESFVFPAPLLAIASASGSDFVAVAWEGTVVLVDPHDRPARGVLPWRAQSSVPGAVTNLAMRPAGDAIKLLLTMRGSDQELALVLRPSVAPPSPPPVAAAPAEVRRTAPPPLKTPESAPNPLAAAIAPAVSQAPASRVEIESVPVPATPAKPAPASIGDTPPQPHPSPIVSPPATAAAECIPDANELGVIAGRIDDPAGLAAELIVHGPDNVLREAARVVLQPAVGGACFRIAGLNAGRYRVQVMGLGGASLRTRPQFVILDFTPDRAATTHFTVDGRL